MSSKVSVVIPSYNSADLLPRAIGSVLNQTHSNFEVIIVDDGSTDNTDKVVSRYHDNRIQFYQHDVNKGGSSARNTGIAHASGDYIAFLDADDEWHPRKLELQLNELESRGSEYVAVHCDRAYEMSLVGHLRDKLAAIIGTVDTNTPKEGGEELIKDILLMNLSTGASTLLVEAETVDAVSGFDEDFPRHQDWEFLIRVLKLGKISYVNRRLVTKHDTGEPEPDIFKKGKEQLLKTFSEEISILESEGHKIIHTQNLHLAKIYLESGELVEGLRRSNISTLTTPEILGLGWSILSGVKHNALE